MLKSSSLPLAFAHCLKHVGFSCNISGPMNSISVPWHMPFSGEAMTALDGLEVTEFKCSSQKRMKTILAILAIVTFVGLAWASPTISVNDNGGGLSTVPVSSASGSVVYSSSDSFWSLVIATGLASPPYAGYGTLSDPYMDLSIHATSLSVPGANLHPLTISFSSDKVYGPSSGEFLAQLSGQVLIGSGQTVTFNTYANTTLLITSGNVPGPGYVGSWTSGDVNVGNPYSLTEVITIQASSVAGASYSVGGTLYASPVPVLAIIRSAGNVVLTWPTNDAGFTLQSTTNLASSSVWSTNLPSAVVVNTNWVVTNAISGTRKFYRLIQ
jgi:hypothetical protein